MPKHRRTLHDSTGFGKVSRPSVWFRFHFVNNPNNSNNPKYSNNSNITLITLRFFKKNRRGRANATDKKTSFLNVWHNLRNYEFRVSYAIHLKTKFLCPWHLPYKIHQQCSGSTLAGTFRDWMFESLLDNFIFQNLLTEHKFFCKNNYTVQPGHWSKFTTLRPTEQLHTRGWSGGFVFKACWMIFFFFTELAVQLYDL